MATARQKHDWSQTSVMLALIEIVHYGGKRKLKFNPAKWNPFSSASERREKPQGTPITKDTIGTLKAFLPKHKRKAKAK